MPIHAPRFLELTLLLSAAGCGPRAAPDAPTFEPLPAGSAWPEATALPPAPAAPEPAVAVDTEADAPSCNDQGNPSSCALILPTCESGEAAACQHLARVLRPAVVQRYATCVAKRQHGTCVPETATRGCLRAALRAGCIDPSAEGLCHDLQQQCRTAGKKPTYDLGDCAKVVSAARARPGRADWYDANLDLLGPADESGSCTLAGFLPQRPFAR